METIKKKHFVIVPFLLQSGYLYNKDVKGKAIVKVLLKHLD